MTLHVSNIGISAFQSTFLILSALPFLSLAQQADTASVNSNSTETVVVTGTRIPKLLSDSPVQVDVIDKATIQRLSNGTLRQVLSVIPGVSVARTDKSGYSVQLQGFDGDHVLILKDGQPLVSPTGSSVDLDQISVYNIAQIEVIRGAASVLYGSAAMGGVINIITQKEQDPHVQLGYELATYDNNRIADARWEHILNLSAATEMNDWQASIQAQASQNPGFDYDNLTTLQDAASNDKSFINIALGGQWHDFSINAQSQYLQEDKQRILADIPGQTEQLRYGTDVTQWQHDVKLAHNNNWHVALRHINHDEQSGNSNGKRDTHIVLNQLDSQKTWMPAPGDKSTEWVAGATLQHDSLNQTKLDTGLSEIDNEDRQSIDAYLQANTRLGDWRWLAGGRVQHDSDFGWHHALRTNISLQHSNNGTDWHFRAGVGQSYRVPNLKERFYVFDHSNLGYIVLGNSQLQPETANSANIGVTLTFQNAHDWRFESSVNAHYADTKDFITTLRDDAQSLVQGLDVSTYENIENATLSGIDIGFSASHTNWQIQGDYNYLETKDNTQARLTDRPRHQAKLSVTRYFETLRSQLQVYGVYKSDEKPDATFDTITHNQSTVWNLVYQHNITDALTLRVGAENLFDEHQDTTLTSLGTFDIRDISSRRIFASMNVIFD